MNLKDKFPILLFLIYCVEFVLLGINPIDRTTWIAENVTALVPVFALVIMYIYKVRFSNTAYLLMAIFIYCHTIGGHYTFEKVPFDFVTELFNFQRNNFDRMCHFMVGFFAYPLLEAIERGEYVKGRGLAITVVVMGIFGFAGIFEIVEWLYAEFSNPEAGIAFLGSQGDIWDAQKDILADGLGAITTSILYCITNKTKEAL
ncbi:MAG: DUF2238 domain-containing protein [Opitutales bacterium]